MFVVAQASTPLLTEEQVRAVEVGSTVVLAIFTIVLAIATWRYYRQSSAQTEEMEVTRKENIRPVLKPAIINRTGLHYIFTIQNTGNGAAHDIEANWGFNHLDHSRSWKSAIITSDEQRQFAIPFGEEQTMALTEGEIKEELDDEDTELVFEAEYADPVGRSYNTEENIDVLNSVGQGAGFEITQRDSLEQIQGDVKKVRKETKKIRRDTGKQRRAVETIAEELSARESLWERIRNRFRK
jgi:hypothetical protein